MEKLIEDTQEAKRQKAKQSMDKLIENTQEVNRQKTPQERLRERCRNGSGKSKSHFQQRDIKEIKALAQMPRTRAMQKKAAQYLPPEQFLALRDLWKSQNKHTTTTQVTTSADKQTPTVVEPTQKVIDPVSGRTRDACIVTIHPMTSK